MSGEKRAASQSFGTTQLVKRQKSDANLNGSAVARVNGSGSNALVQGVSPPISNSGTGRAKARIVKGAEQLMEAGVSRHMALRTCRHL